MLSAFSQTWPEGDGWLYEPKWDGFRALVFWDGDELFLQSRDCKPLSRYFPELVAACQQQLPAGLVLDGEVVIVGSAGLDFDALLLRIHPAASRIELLARSTPASFVAFDLLAEGGNDLRALPQAERRRRLEAVWGSVQPPLHLTPVTRDRTLAQDWFHRFEGAGLDGVIAKPEGLAYQSDGRALVKLKHRRTADCVVGGFRWRKDAHDEAVGSLLLGLYDAAGELHHVGFTSSFDKKKKRELTALLRPYVAGEGEGSFGQGRTPGGPSRWTAGRDMSWVSLRPELVCEVVYDHLQGDRFRHGATFVRWRSDKPARQCDYAQLQSVVPYELSQVFGLSV